MLVGALAPTVIFTLVGRSVRGRSTLARTRGVTLAAFSTVTVLAGGGVAYWMVRRAIDAFGADGTGAMPGPGYVLLFGLALGLPFALPTLVLAWNEERAKARAKSRKKDWVPTKDDRRKYAQDLERQIRELSTPPRDVAVSVGGEGARVLKIEGPIEAREGERLTKALSADLKEVGIKRVEGTGTKGEWWARV